jgi:hypothetical protein
MLIVALVLKMTLITLGYAAVALRRTLYRGKIGTKIWQEELIVVYWQHLNLTEIVLHRILGVVPVMLVKQWRGVEGFAQSKKLKTSVWLIPGVIWILDPFGQTQKDLFRTLLILQLLPVLQVCDQQGKMKIN